MKIHHFGSFLECYLDAVGDDAIGTCDLPIGGDAEITFDLEGAYNFNDTWEVVLGARNAFGSFPDNHAWPVVSRSMINQDQGPSRYSQYVLVVV